MNGSVEVFETDKYEPNAYGGEFLKVEHVIDTKGKTVKSLEFGGRGLDPSYGYSSVRYWVINFL